MGVVSCFLRDYITVLYIFHLSHSDFTHLSPKSLSKILRYTLDVCDNFAMILRFSHFPDNVEKNFRLFQTTFLLRNMNSILYPTILETRIHSYAHFE